MAWTAELVSKEVTRDEWKFVVRYTDGVDVINEQIKTRSPTIDALKEMVRNRLTRLDQRTAIDSATPIGPINITPRPAESAARTQARDRLRELRQLLDMQSVGVNPTGADTRITQLRGQLVTALEADNTLRDIFSTGSLV